jgi:hypothetical protein
VSGSETFKMNWKELEKFTKIKSNIKFHFRKGDLLCNIVIGDYSGAIALMKY